jgi:Pyridoxamine 5'-phosphate oxidase
MKEKTTMGVPQGDLKLLDSQIAKDLLNSRVPARLAYIAKDGTPRVIPTWFYWDGSELVMATFIAGPQVRHAPARPAALRENPAVAITIDTEGFPPHVLLIRGQASVTEVDGIVEEFERAAQRYSGTGALMPISLR